MRLQSALIVVAIVMLVPSTACFAQSSTRSVTRIGDTVNLGNPQLAEPTLSRAFHGITNAGAAGLDSYWTGSDWNGNQDNYVYSQSPTRTGFVNGHGPQLIKLKNDCGGRPSVSPPCIDVPSYGGCSCFGRAYGRPLFGKWHGF